MNSPNHVSSASLSSRPWLRWLAQVGTLFGGIHRWSQQSIWLSIVAKGLTAVVAFAALAYVGQGARNELEHARMAPVAASPDRSPQSPLGSSNASSTISASAQGPGSSATPACSSAKAASPAWTSDGRLILNLAGVDDFVKLPGVGKKRAQAIIKLRTRLRRFRRVRDLLRVRGIGYRSLKRLKPLVVVDPPKPPKAKASSSAARAE